MLRGSPGRSPTRRSRPEPVSRAMVGMMNIACLTPYPVDELRRIWSTDLARRRIDLETLAYVLSYALATSDIMKETLRDLALDAGLEAREIDMDLITQPLILDALAEGEAKGRAEGEGQRRDQGKSGFAASPVSTALRRHSRGRGGERSGRRSRRIWRHGRMPCLMRGSLTTFSRMEAPAERRTGAREASCAGLARSEAAARAAHRASTWNSTTLRNTSASRTSQWSGPQDYRGSACRETTAPQVGRNSPNESADRRFKAAVKRIKMNCTYPSIQRR